MASTLSEKSDPEKAVSSEETAIGKDGGTSTIHGIPDVANLTQANMRGLRMPEILTRLTPEQRLELETRLRRKIDWRLLPIIILMCQ